MSDYSLNRSLFIQKFNLRSASLYQDLNRSNLKNPQDTVACFKLNLNLAYPKDISIEMEIYIEKGLCG